MHATDRRQARLRRDLDRLIHVLLTHSEDASESKQDFCRRVAWDVENIIDEIENPDDQEGLQSLSDVMGDWEARHARIRRRQQERNNDDWG